MDKTNTEIIKSFYFGETIEEIIFTRINDETPLYELIEELQEIDPSINCCEECGKDLEPSDEDYLLEQCICEECYSEYKINQS